MVRAMKASLAIIAAVLMAAAPAPAAAAQAANFTLVNNTDIAFTAMMARRYGTQQWMPLAVRPVPVASRGRGAVEFSDPDCAFDLQATLPDGRVVVWSGVNLCDAKVVTLNRDSNGVLWIDYD